MFKIKKRATVFTADFELLLTHWEKINISIVYHNIQKKLDANYFTVHRIFS